MSTKTQLTGGPFTDAEGNVIANGYLEFKLNQDSSVPGTCLVGAGKTIRIALDSDGNVASSASTPPAANQYVWANTSLLPINSFYRVTGFTAEGQPAWGPNNQQVTGSGGTFDVGTWVPNVVFSWNPPVSAPLLETNGTSNAVQSLLNLVQGTHVTITDNGNGSVTIANSAPAIELETNGVANGDQSKLNLVAGTGMTLTDDGSGDVTLASTVAGLPSSANVGDTLRYNEYGDSAWDKVIGVPRFATAYPTSSGAVTSMGAPISPSMLLSGTGQGPTATESYFSRMATSSSANTNVLAMLAFGSTATLGPNFFSFGSIRRMATRIRPSTSSNNIRIWVGLTSDTNSSPFNSEAGTNTPNFKYMAFRYAAGTDSFWQAVCGTDSTHQTVINTNVAVDTTNSTLLEIAPAASGGPLFFINGVQVAQVTTNVPALSQACQAYFQVDNQNNAHGYNWDWWHSIVTMK